jgi:hypothetical protein
VQDPANKEILELEFPYELSLMHITLQDFDRSKYYHEKLKDAFIKKWRNVKSYTDN